MEEFVFDIEFFEMICEVFDGFFVLEVCLLYLVYWFVIEDLVDVVVGFIFYLDGEFFFGVVWVDDDLFWWCFDGSFGMVFFDQFFECECEWLQFFV